MAIIIHLKVVKGLLIRSRIASSSLVSERDRVLHRLACSWRLSQSKGSLSLCVCGAKHAWPVSEESSGSGRRHGELGHGCARHPCHACAHAGFWD
jgi:hypothetical protein